MRPPYPSSGQSTGPPPAISDANGGAAAAPHRSPQQGSHYLNPDRPRPPGAHLYRFVLFLLSFTNF